MNEYCAVTQKKQLRDGTISIRGIILVHKTSLTPPHFIEGPIPSQDRERSMNMYVRGIDVASFCDSDI
jgi:hypothetical protein